MPGRDQCRAQCTMPVCDVNMTNSYDILALYLFQELCNQLTVCGPIAGAVLMYWDQICLRAGIVPVPLQGPDIDSTPQPARDRSEALRHEPVT